MRLGFSVYGLGFRGKCRECEMKKEQADALDLESDDLDPKP